MWDVVEKTCDPVKVLTRAGYNLIQAYSIKAAHPMLPYVLHFLAMMCSLGNGAKSVWFPNSPSPVFMMVSSSRMPFLFKRHALALVNSWPRVAA